MCVLRFFFYFIVNSTFFCFIEERPYLSRLVTAARLIKPRLLRDINRTSCPVAVRKEQIDYHAYHSPLLGDFSLLFFPFLPFVPFYFSICTLSSLLSALSVSFALVRTVRLSFSLSKRSRYARDFLFGVDGAKLSSN